MNSGKSAGTSQASVRRLERSKKGSRVARRIAIIAAVIVVLLLLVQVIASPIAKSIVNKKLAALPDFTGHTDEVKVALWRGAGEVREFTLFERGHENEPPLVHVKKAAMAVSIPSLFRGKIGGSSVIEDAEFNVVKREGEDVKDKADQAAEKVKQKKEEIKKWQDALREAFPMEISKFELKNGKVRFLDNTHTPNVDLAVEQLHVVATGLRNRPEGDPMPAKVEVTGVTTGGGQMRANVQGDPLARGPRFNGNFELKNLSLPAMNPFMLAYTGTDVSKGTFEIYTEVNAENGGYQGYTKPFLRDLDFKNATDKNKSFVKRVTETAASAVTSVLKNDDTKKVATQTPFSGTFENPDVGIWESALNLFRNAFVQALREGLGADPKGR